MGVLERRVWASRRVLEFTGGYNKMVSRDGQANVIVAKLKGEFACVNALRPADKRVSRRDYTGSDRPVLNLGI